MRGKLIRTVFMVAFLTTVVALPHPLRCAAQSKDAADDPSGMFSFLRDGEFVQLTVEDKKVSGYISRFGDSDSDKGSFIDQFFDKASLDGNQLSFATKTVHGTWYEFNGVIATTPGKQPSQEGYRVIKGTLIEHVTDANKVDKPRQRNVEFMSFPPDLTKP